MSDYKKLFVERLGVHCPFALPTEAEWVAVERNFRCVIPHDFKQLVEIVGDGVFRGDLRLFNPSVLVGMIDRALVGGIVQSLRINHDIWLTPPNFPLWPEPNGAFPLAVDGAGLVVLHSRTDEGIDCWFYVERNHFEWQAYEMPCWEFFFKLFEGQLDGFGRVFFTEREEEWESLPFFARFPWHQDS